jgi:anti-anti-sigma factor
MLTIETGSEGKFTVLAIAGPVDGETFEQFKDAIHRACQTMPAWVLLDCARLTYMNSKALGLLTAYHRVCLANKGHLALCNLNRKIVRTMDLLGLGKLLKIYDTRAQAVKALP